MFEFLNRQLLLRGETLGRGARVADVWAFAVGGGGVVINIHKFFKIAQKSLIFL